MRPVSPMEASASRAPSAHVDHALRRGGRPLRALRTGASRAWCSRRTTLSASCARTPSAANSPAARRDRAGARRRGPRVAFRPGTLAALCAVGLLVRFQSSLAAIRRSLRRLDAVLRRFGEALGADPPRLLDLQADPAGPPAPRPRESGRPRRSRRARRRGGRRCWTPRGSARSGGWRPLEHPERVRPRPHPRGAARDREVIADLLAALPSDDERWQDRGADRGARADPRGPARKGAPGLAGSARPDLHPVPRHRAIRPSRDCATPDFNLALIDGGVPVRAARCDHGVVRP